MCAPEMKTWATRYNLGEDGVAEAGRLTADKDTSELWQKPNAEGVTNEVLAPDDAVADQEDEGDALG
jgi:hypothetical protein